mmetsp:Transcript_135973/g.339131  ORF Transcript_135973/g.339131 Transcript_135973/m.339131 type:complete len:273 (-) Transcript_135973:63-881(-)
MRPAVARDDRGVRARPELRRVGLVDRGLQRHLAVRRRQRHELRRRQRELADEGVLIAENGAQFAAVAQRAQRRRCGFVRGTVGVDEGLALAVNHDAVYTWLLGDALRRSSAEAHPEKVPLQPRALIGADEVDQAALLIDCSHFLHLPRPAGERLQAGLRVVDVQVPESTSLTGPKELSRVPQGLEHVVDVDPDVCLLPDHNLRAARGRVAPQDCQLGLLTVYHLHGEAAVWEPLHAGEVEILAEGPRQIEGLRPRYAPAGRRIRRRCGGGLC